MNLILQALILPITLLQSSKVTEWFYIWPGFLYEIQLHNCSTFTADFDISTTVSTWGEIMP